MPESPGESLGEAAAYFTIEELRAQYPDLANATKYPDAKLAADRTFAEQWFEAAAHVAYIPREITETLTGHGRRRLFLSARAEVGPVWTVEIDGVALDAGALADLVVRRYGVVERAATWPKDATIEITYTHGYDEPVELAKQAVMMLTAEKAKPSTIPARATSLSTDVGNYRISQADKTGKTGIPNVDAIIGLLGDDKPATG
jgi:hypothetical protein